MNGDGEGPGADSIQPAMRFSLIVATVGRTQEIATLMASMAASEQPLGDIEVIIVDQNPDARLAPVVKAAPSVLTVRWVHSEPGLSKARNAGLEVASGDVVGFPDDDCTYVPDTLPTVAAILGKVPELDGVSGLLVEGSAKSIAARSGPRLVTRWNVWKTTMSATVFLRRRTCVAAGRFDELLGLGAKSPWQSGEETDFLLRALDSGARIRFDPSVRIRHQEHGRLTSKEPWRRARSYGRGMGRVLRTHRYPLWFAALPILIAIGRALRELLTLNLIGARVHVHSALGRLEGLTKR